MTVRGDTFGLGSICVGVLQSLLSGSWVMTVVGEVTKLFSLDPLLLVCHDVSLHVQGERKESPLGTGLAVVEAHLEAH